MSKLQEAKDRQFYTDKAPSCRYCANHLWNLEHSRSLNAGVCSASDIPEEAGLVVRSDKGWHTAKAAPRLQGEIPVETMMSLVFARQRRSAREKRLDDVQAIKFRGFNVADFGGRLKTARVLGGEVGWLLRVAKDVGGVKEATTVLHAEIERRRAEMISRWAKAAGDGEA